tara:strand:+ start:239 stop:1060 length:822 start_codon:yes stop_codon:yes gene_type:complete
VVKNNIKISIITLTKNDDDKFLKTLKSISSQSINFGIEWLIIDGSNDKCQIKKSYLIKEYISNNNLYVQYINSEKLNLRGIYQCMNFGKEIASGNFLIFLNSGDIFFNKNSLSKFFENSLNLKHAHGLVFGQANIIAPSNLSWNFPGYRLNNIKNWLYLFEPNHQSMLISSKLAKKFDFPLEYNSLGDGYWKRKILDNSLDIIYMKEPVVKFYLDGISSIKPTKKIFKNIITNNKISLKRKTIFFIKFLFPRRLFYLYNMLQKIKSLLIDFIF